MNQASDERRLAAGLDRATAPAARWSPDATGRGASDPVAAPRAASPGLASAIALVLLGPSLLLAGALGFQHLLGLAPCEMCFWQRWPLLAAIALGLVALVLRGRAGAAGATVLAGFAVLASAAIAAFHVGVERHWWPGPTQCASTDLPTSGQDFAAAMLAAPILRCDAPAWTLGGVSLAGFNLLFSTMIGLGVLWLSLKRR